VTADSNDDFIKRLQELFHTGNIPNLFSTEQFSKQIQEFNTQTKTSWDQFLNVLQTAYIEKTIDTHSHGGPDYKTTIKINGDVTNQFPNPPPNASDVYWARHNQLVDQAVALQKEIIDKVTDTIGTIVQKIVSPISISTSDLVNLVNLFKKS
jgi:hypothetical protein